MATVGIAKTLNQDTITRRRTRRDKAERSVDSRELSTTGNRRPGGSRAPLEPEGKQGRGSPGSLWTAPEDPLPIKSVNRSLILQTSRHARLVNNARRASSLLSAAQEQQAGVLTAFVFYFQER